MLSSTTLKRLQAQSQKPQKRVSSAPSRSYTTTTRKFKSVHSSRRTRLLILNYLASFVLVSIIAFIIVGLVIVTYYSRELPNPNRLIERSYELSTKFFDRNGTPLYEVFGEKNRSLITLDQVSPNVLHATLAAEDASFYQHKGYSIRGIFRAIKNMVTGSSLQSGSTLTQQVVKNTLLTQEQTISRKIKEFILSLQLENAYSKDQILQMYLNETPYGGQSYGILTASKSFFNKFPSELTVAESAYLAGLPQRPSYYSYYGSNPDAGIERKNYVLYLMKERGWTAADGTHQFLSDEEYNTAKDEQLHFQTSFLPFKAPHFVLYVKQILADMFGEDAVQQGGLQVTTSLDLSLQQKAEDIVVEELGKAKNLNVGNGGLVGLDPRTGQILAMVGSKGYFLKSEPEGCTSGITGDNSCTFEPNLNVTLARRQPGSTIKPITYATLLSKGYIASFPFLDVPTTFPGSSPDKPYNPVNYDGTFRGPMSLRKALGNSLNIPAVKALKMAGLNSMIDLAEKMGISTFGDRSRYGLSLTLGGGETKLLEMTNAFAVFAAKGVYRAPAAILEVKNSNGDVLYKFRDNGGEQVLGDDVSFIVSDILSDDGARASTFGAGSLLNIPNNRVAVKTGTTDDKRDNYAIGYTPSVVFGVWVGNNNNDRMNPILASGISGATPIWRRIMIEYLKDKTPEKFDPPKNVTKMDVDVLTGMLPFEDNPTRPEWFINGTQPTARSPWYQKIEVCKSDGKIANQSCIDADKTKVKTYISIKAELPEWQDNVDKWVQETYKDNSEYFPPKTISHFGDSGDTVYVDFATYKDGASVPLAFRLNAEISASNDVQDVSIYLDGKKVTTDGSEPYGYSFNFKSSDVGVHTFKYVATDTSGHQGDSTIKLNVTVPDSNGTSF